MYMLDIVQRKGKRNDNIRSANIYKRKLTRVY